MKSDQIFTCPSDTKLKRLKGGIDKNAGGYAIPMENFIWGSANKAVSPTLMKIADAAGTAWLGDASSGSYVYVKVSSNTWTNTASNVTYVKGIPVMGLSTNGNNKWVGRHFDGVNFCYVDGHVKWKKMDSLIDNRAMFTTALD